MPRPLKRGLSSHSFLLLFRNFSYWPLYIERPLNGGLSSHFFLLLFRDFGYWPRNRLNCITIAVTRPNYILISLLNKHVLHVLGTSFYFFCFLLLFFSLLFFNASSESWFQSIALQKLKLLFRNSLFGLGKTPCTEFYRRCIALPSRNVHQRQSNNFSCSQIFPGTRLRIWGGGGGGRGEGKNGVKQQKIGEQCSFRSPDSHSTRFRSPIFFRLFCPVRSLVPGSLISESGDNTNQLCNVSITCNWGPLLL